MKTQEADQKIAELRKEMSEKQKMIRELVEKREPESIDDYELHDKHGNTVKLSSLFRDKQELLVIHNMGKSCVYCTMWADGFRGITDQLQDRASMALISPDDPETLKKFSEERDWNFPVMSSSKSKFIEDLGYKTKEGNYWPGVSSLKMKDGKIYRVAKDFFGPGDPFNPSWHFMDLLADGVNNWTPKYKYS